MKTTILVIDDSKAMRYLLQTILGRQATVIAAPDACSAMQWLSKRNIPDLIIADPQLEDCDDWELIANLKYSGIFGNIPIIVLSSLPEQEVREKMIEYNRICGYFTKPFNPVDLVEMVKHTVTNENYSGISSHVS